MKILSVEELISPPKEIREIVVTRADCEKSLYFLKKFNNLPASWARFEIKKLNPADPVFKYLEKLKIKDFNDTPFVICYDKSIHVVTNFADFEKWLAQYEADKAKKDLAEERREVRERLLNQAWTR